MRVILTVDKSDQMSLAKGLENVLFTAHLSAKKFQIHAWFLIICVLRHPCIIREDTEFRTSVPIGILHKGIKKQKKQTLGG